MGNSAPHKVQYLYMTTQQQFNKKINKLIHQENGQKMKKQYLSNNLRLLECKAYRFDPQKLNQSASRIRITQIRYKTSTNYVYNSEEKQLCPKKLTHEELASFIRKLYRQMGIEHYTHHEFNDFLSKKRMHILRDKSHGSIANSDNDS